MTTRVWRRFTAVLTLCSLFVNLLPRADVAVARTIDPIESPPLAARPVAQSAGTILFLTGSAASAADDAIAARLATSYTVVRKNHDQETLADADGKALIYISATVDSGKIGATFANTPVPMVVNEHAVYDDLGMTGTANGPDYGYDSSPSTTQLVLTDPLHPLAAGLSSPVTVFATAHKLPFGRGSTAAAPIATVAGWTTRHMYFAYDTGAAMVAGIAPARRVGFFLDPTAAVDLTTDGWTLFDTAVAWAAGSGTPAPTATPTSVPATATASPTATTGPPTSTATAVPSATPTTAPSATPIVPTTAPSATPTATLPSATATSATPTTIPSQGHGGPVVLIVGSTPAVGSADARIVQQLTSLGYSVTTVVQSAASSSSANGQRLVLISSTVSSSTIGNAFRDVAVPVMLWENGLYDLEMGMTSTTLGTDYGTTASQATLTIQNPSHPMAAGLSGSVSVMSTGRAMPYGSPNANAVRIAGTSSTTTKVVIFGYDQGSVMVSAIAPARRVGFFFNDDTPLVATADGWALFDAAVLWAVSTSVPATATPISSATPMVTATPAATATPSATSTPLSAAITPIAWEPFPITSASPTPVVPRVSMNQCVDADEPNNSQAHATELRLGTTITQAFCERDDVDWLAFQGVAGGAYTINTTNLYPGVDTVLAVYDAQGTLLAENDDAESPEYLHSISFSWGSQVSAVVPNDGTYFLRISSFPTRQQPAGFYYQVNLSHGNTVCTTTETANNTASQAEVLTLGMPARRSFCRGDEDWYTVNGTAGTWYSLALSDLSVDYTTDVRVYRGDAQTLLHPTTTMTALSRTPRLTFLAVADEPLYIQLRRTDPTRAAMPYYTLTIAGNACRDAGMPLDDSVGEAQLLHQAELAGAFCAHANDRYDWYRLAVQAGTEYRLLLTSDHPDASGMGISFRDQYNQPIPDPASPPQYLTDRLGGLTWAVWTPSTSGEVYVRATSPKAGAEMQYRLRMVRVDPCADESNSSAVTATTASVGFSAIATLCTATPDFDEDWYQFTPTTAITYHLHLHQATDFAITEIELYAGATLLASAEQIVEPLTAGQTYHIRVKTGLNDPVVRYQLGIAACPYVCNTPSEPNNDLAHATVMQVDQPYHGTFSSNLDHDYLRFQGEATALYRVTIFGQATGTYPFIDILGNDRAMSLGAAHGGIQDYIFHAKTTGWYTLHVSMLGNIQTFSSDWRYSVLVERIQAPLAEPIRTQATAPLLTANQWYTRTTVNGQDWFRIQTLPHQSYQLVIRHAKIYDTVEFFDEQYPSTTRFISPTVRYETNTISQTFDLRSIALRDGRYRDGYVVHLTNDFSGIDTYEVALIATQELFSLQPDDVDEAYGFATDDDREVLRLVNQERLKYGLAPFKYDDRLRKAAYTQVQDMTENQFLGHQGSDGSWPHDRALRFNYENGLNGYAGELGYGGGSFYYGPQQAVTAWMSSKLHRHGILHRFARDVGPSLGSYRGALVIGYQEHNYPIFINTEALTTTSRDVDVLFSAPILGSPILEPGWSVALGHSPIFTPTWIPYTVTLGTMYPDQHDQDMSTEWTFTRPLSIPWTLPAGPGEQRVFAMYRSPEGVISVSSDSIIVIPPTVADPTQPALPPALLSYDRIEQNGSSSQQIPLLLPTGPMQPMDWSLRVQSALADLGRAHQGSLAGAGVAVPEYAVLRLPDLTPSDPADDSYALLWHGRLWRLVHDWTLGDTTYQLDRQSAQSSDLDGWDLRITRQSGASHGVDGGWHWIMTDTQGRTWQFGANATSAWRMRDAAGHAHHWRWNLDHVTDLLGNRQQWTYATETATHAGAVYERAGYPLSVAWGGNPQHGIAPTADVVFHYEPRTAGGIGSDQRPADLFYTSQRLAMLEARVAGTVARQYRFSYTSVVDGDRSRLLLATITEHPLGATAARTTLAFTYTPPEVAGEGYHLRTISLNGATQTAYRYQRMETRNPTYMVQKELHTPTAEELAWFFPSTAARGASVAETEPSCDTATIDQTVNKYLEYAYQLTVLPDVDALPRVFSDETLTRERAKRDCYNRVLFERYHLERPYQATNYKSGCNPGDADEQQRQRAMAATTDYCHKTVRNFQARMLPSGVERLEVPAAFDDVRAELRAGAYEFRQTGYIYNANGQPVYTDAFGVMDDPTDDLYIQRSYDDPQFPDLVTAEATYDHTNTLRAKTTYAYVPGTRLVAATGRWLLEEQRILTTTLTYDPQGRVHSTINPLGETTTYGYNALGLTSAITNPLGVVATMTYNPLGQLIAQTDGLGATTHSVYDPITGQLRMTIDALGATTIYTYTATGLKQQERNPLGGVTTYGYTALGQTAAVTNALGMVTSYMYDGSGRLVSTTTPVGTSTTVYDGATGQPSQHIDPLGVVAATTATDGAGKPITTTDATGATNTTSYDGYDRVVAETDATGATTRYRYDLFGNRIATTNALSATTYQQFDSLQRLRVMTDTLGAVTTYTYDDAGRTIAVTDARGATTCTQYDAAGRVIASTDALSHTTYTTRDAVGRAIRVTDPLGFATVTRYDRMGRVVATTNPLSHTTTYQYDAMGNTVAITNPRGLVSRTNYNVLGQRIADENPLKQVTTYQYDAMGRLTTVTDTLGLVTHTQYDAVGRTVGTSTSMGFSTATAYDVRGNPSLITDTLGITTTTAVDQLGRTTAVTTAGQFATQTRYDAVGNVNQSIDANGVTTGYRHDAAGRVTAVIEHAQPGQPRTITTNVETLIGYDAVGNTIAITDANGHGRTTQYTLLNQPAQICDGLQRCTTITYTARGERATVTDPRGVVTTYTYDPAGRVVTITYSDGTPAVNYGYNPTNSVIAMVDGSGLTTYTYDALERMTTRSQNGVTITTTIALDERSVTTDYWGTGSVAATRDPMGRTTTMTAWNAPTTHYTYRGATTAVTAMDRPALGQQTTQTYRADGALLQIRYGPDTDLTYTRDAVGLPTMLAETLNGQALTTQLAYDARQRVIAVTQTSDLASVPASSQHYTLDAVGNRLHDGASATTHTYDAADQVLGFTYDQAGNLLDDGQTSYTYDGANRLRQTQSVTMTVAYGYNGWGTLVTETITHGLAVTHTLFLWDETSALPRLIGTQASNGVETQYAYGPEGVHAVRERQHTAPWLVAYTQLDAQGTIRALITPAGVEQQRTHFSIWGTIRSQTGTSSNRLGYTGELMGHDGTVYLRARQYLPTMGRFLQQDSFAGIPTSPQSLHKYTYAHNSPAWHTDPSGNLVPLLLGIWAVAEVGISIYDSYTTVDTLLDPCVSGWEKVATGTLWIAGIFLPGGGYASGGKAAVSQLDHIDEVADVLYHIDEFAGASDELVAAGNALDNTTGALDDAADVAHSVEQVDDADALLQVADDLPCVPGNSFVAGTLVESSHGLVPIETLVVGDTVWAIDPQTNQAGYYPITWTTAHTATMVIVLTVQPLTDTLGLAQEQILATDHHPFWVYGRGWIDASKLRVGDRLLGDAGYTITVVDVDVELQSVMVYNFTVDTLHTYTIGHAGILVHNTGCDETVSYYRIQGGDDLKQRSFYHITVDEDGIVRFARKNINISRGNLDHAKYFLFKRRAGGQIYEFKIPKWLDELLLESSIPQSFYNQNVKNQGGLAPKLVDPTRPGQSFEIPPIWAEWFEENIIPGSLKIIK